ncbi:MAG: flagellar filament capping protein FliD [Deltaproteobacteria bacterium]
MLTSPGIGSGLDINSLVSQLVQAEGATASFRLNQREAAYTAEISAIGSLKSALSEFSTAVGNLDDIDDFRLRTTTTTNADVITASADDTATPGSYDVEVVRLAAAHRVRSQDFAAETTVVGEGTLTLSMGSASFDVDIDSTNSTLAGIRDAINAATDNTGVSATIINVDDGGGGTVSRLVLSSSDTGLSNAISVSVSDTDGIDTDNAGLSQLSYDGVTDNMVELVPAEDALVRVFNQDISSATNTITGAITGVTLTLKEAQVGTTETVAVTYNKAAVISRVNSFVKAYNSLQETFTDLGRYDAASGSGGPLLGDATLRSIASRIRNEFATGLSDSTLTYRTLADIGVTRDEFGKLSLDSGTIDAAFAADPDAIGDIFASAEGYASRLSAAVEPYVETNGLLDARVDGLESRIDRVGEQRERLELRLEAFEARTRAQFFAMDELVAQLSTTSEYLGQQLANLPGFTRRSNQ